MASKAARRRNREQRRLHAQEPAYEPEERVACADVDLATIDGLLDDAADVLTELLVAASQACETWPAAAETDELRAVFAAVRTAATESRAELVAIRLRAAQCRDDGLHLHVVGDRITRMVLAADDRDIPDDDIPF